MGLREISLFPATRAQSDKFLDFYLLRELSLTAILYNHPRSGLIIPASALLLASVSCRPQTSFPQQPPASAQQGGQDLGTGISELADGARSTAFLIEVTPTPSYSRGW